MSEQDRELRSWSRHIGDKTRFAIETEVEYVSGDWVYGHFRFWLRGEACGN